MKKTTLSLLICLWAVSAFAQTSVMDFYNAREKEIQMLIADTSRCRIEVKDEKNGFISYLHVSIMSGTEEMAYYFSDDGKRFVAIVAFFCGPSCKCGYPNFYELKNGKLINQTEKYLPKAIQKSIKSHYQQEEEKIKAKFKAKYGNHNTHFSFGVKLPRIGTTIQIGMMENGMIDDEKFYLVGELEYNVVNGTFAFVKKTR